MLKSQCDDILFKGLANKASEGNKLPQRLVSSFVRHKQ